MKTTIELALTLTTPMNISSGETGWYIDTKTGYKYRLQNNQSKDRFPMTRTTRLPLPTITEDEEGKVRNTEIPIIPANTLRGIMRRRVADLVFERTGTPLSLDAYHSLTCGNRSGRSKEEKASAKEKAVEAVNTSVRDFADKLTHPVVGLLGGTAAMVPSSMVTSIGFPILDTTIEHNLVPSWLAGYAKPIHKPLWDCFFSRKDDALRVADNAPMHIANFQESMDAYLEKLKRTDSKDADDNKKIGLATFSATESVLPTVAFSSRWEINDNTIGAEGVGLFFLALERFANHQKLGGHVAKGYGRYRLDAFLIDGETRENILSFNEKSNTHTLVVNDYIAAAIETWNEYDLDVETLERLLQ